MRVSNVIGLIVPDISNPFFATVARHVEQAARAGNYSVLLGDSQESTEIEVQTVALMQSRGVDGLIIAPVSGHGEHLIQFARRRMPQVLVDRAPPEHRVASVVVDNFGAAREGVRRLATSGHRAIGCIRGRKDSYSDQERFRGYRAAMKEHGFHPEKAWIVGGDYLVESGREGMRALLRSRTRPTAVMALGNLLALGALETLREAGITVPGGMSLISFDEQPWAALLAPPLTTIAQPAGEIGERAVELLFGSLRGERGKENLRLVLPYTIVDRDSVRVLATGFPDR